jgi:hypothetical protein
MPSEINSRITSLDLDQIKYLSNLRAFAAVSDWKLTNSDSTGIEFIRKRAYPQSYFLWGSIGLLLAGIGILIWLAGVFYYFCQRDEILFIPLEDIESKSVKTDQFKWR